LWRQLGGGVAAAAGQWRRSARRRLQLGRSSLAAARQRWQRGGGAQCDCGSSLAAAWWRWQLGVVSQRDGGGSLAEAERRAERWRRQSGGRAQRDGGGSLGVTWQWRQLGGGSLAGKAWHRHGGGGRAVAALIVTAAAAWLWRGHKNQQSTKSTEATMMTATTITIETMMTATTITIEMKGTAVAAEARLQRGGSGQLGGGGGSVNTPRRGNPFKLTHFKLR